MNTNLVVIQGDITQLKVDAIVQSSALDECLQAVTDRETTKECLSQAYMASLKSAVARNARTLAFPNVNDEHLTFSKDQAVQVALTTVRKFLAEQPGWFNEIIFVCWDTENYHLYRAMLGGENRVVRDK